jgi:hypothetical protein
VSTFVDKCNFGSKSSTYSEANRSLFRKQFVDIFRSQGYDGYIGKEEHIMVTRPYLKRIADDLLQARLRSSGAVLIEGAKWCGKTATAARASKSQLYMQDPDKAPS